MRLNEAPQSGNSNLYRRHAWRLNDEQSLNHAWHLNRFKSLPLMKRYPHMKDSGVEWIGEIPEHWETRKLKYFASIQNGKSYEHLKVESGGYPVFGTGGEFARSSEFLYDQSSVLLGRKGTIDKPQFIDSEPFWTSDTVYYTKIRKDVEPLFLFHLVNQIKFDFYKYGSAVPSMTKTHYDEMVFPYPSKTEQTQIVAFLDEKTSKIDRLIAQKERKIELLKEQRKALINQAVTKGLDPTVPMKDSGVEWIGEIPEHWIVSKFNFYIKLRHGHQFRDFDFTESGVRIVKITQLNKNGYLDLSDTSFIDSDRVNEFSDIHIKSGDVLMCLTGGTIGKIIRVEGLDEVALQNYRVGHFSPINSKKLSNDYLFYLMSSDVIIEQIFFEIRETGQPNIGMEDFSRMKIVIPKIEEQINIVQHIKKHLSEIDLLLTKESKKIELLKEYRQALISEVVTGKVDVSDYSKASLDKRGVEV